MNSVLLLFCLTNCIFFQDQYQTCYAKNQLIGTWKMVGLVDHGKKFSLRKLNAFKTKFTFNEEFMIIDTRFTKAEMRYSINAKNRPKTITLYSKEKKSKGIYRLESSMLKIYLAPPGMVRPNSFSSKGCRGHMLVILKR